MALLAVLVCTVKWTVEKEPHVERCLLHLVFRLHVDSC